MRKGFWSYVHKDDEAEGERISKLAKDVVNEYELLAGDTIELFLDKDGIGWGDEWRKKIDDHLESVEFFVPVMTPRYFKSPECRLELNQFVRSASKCGRLGISHDVCCSALGREFRLSMVRLFRRVVTQTDRLGPGCRYMHLSQFVHRRRRRPVCKDDLNPQTQNSGLQARTRHPAPRQRCETPS